MNIDDIRKYNPCYNPGAHLPEDWQGSAADILRVTTAPELDKVWAVCHPGWISPQIAGTIIEWCVEQAQTYPGKATNSLTEWAKEHTSESDAFFACRALFQIAGTWQPQIDKLLELLEAN